nr:hypothetical protein BaRGS_026250 [Batillaria attramentaria]
MPQKLYAIIIVSTANADRMREVIDEFKHNLSDKDGLFLGLLAEGRKDLGGFLAAFLGLWGGGAAEAGSGKCLAALLILSHFSPKRRRPPTGRDLRAAAQSGGMAGMGRHLFLSWSPESGRMATRRPTTDLGLLAAREGETGRVARGKPQSSPVGEAEDPLATTAAEEDVAVAATPSRRTDML